MHTQDRIRHTLLKETPVEITKVHIESLSLAGFIIEILSPVGHQKRRQRHLLQTIFRESRGLDKWRPVEYVRRHTILLDTSHRQGDFTRTKMITMDSHSSHSPKYCGSQSGKLQHSMQVTGTAADNFLEMSSVCSFCVLTVVTLGTKKCFHNTSH